MRLMNKIVSKSPIVARIFLGLIFFVFGLNGFLQFAPAPELPPAAGAFLGALAGAGYMFPLIKSVEILVGIALLTNRFVPFALVLLAPIAVNIAAFHLFLTPGQAGMSVVILAALAFLAWSYRSVYRPLFAAKATPELSLGRREFPAASPAFRAGHGA
jgi:uncharacterized membrane protein YphA (DoxX/SURF4 family)